MQSDYNSWEICEKLDLDFVNSAVGVPRMYALFFHRLSILERATDHKCINDCSYSKRNVGRIQV
jgi:hypothetical protein